MDKLLFFDLLFEGSDVRTTHRKATKYKAEQISDKTVEEAFYEFFYDNGLTPLFTDEHRTSPITVSLIQARSLLKAGEGDGSRQGKAYRILKDFSNYVSMGQDNKMFQSAMFKILYESRDWNGFLINIQKHMDYIDTIDSGYEHNTWNIVWYDKDKSGTKVSKGL